LLLPPAARGSFIKPPLNPTKLSIMQCIKIPEGL
jgi:hypothetical protein